MGTKYNKYAEKYREQIIRSVIQRAGPGFFGWFDICPVMDAAEVLNVSDRNDAYRLLHAYHCVDRLSIPKEIRKRIPELIREALTPDPAARQTEQPTEGRK